ncbi:MAG: hypothetical protein KDD48_04755 [Bdellovibrionales bacterium]|nr:hypothetical protein [Bdellovibrionales bacterium]
MKRKLGLIGIIFLLGVSKGDNLFGEFERVPDTIERGFSIGADFGPLFITGDTKASNPGFQLAFTTGIDIFKYLSIEGIYTMGINEAPPPPFDNILRGGVNTFFFNIAAKGQYPIGRLYPFVEFGPGIIYSTPEYSPGENKKLSFLMAGGLEYYTYLRHYSLYAKATYHLVTIPIDALSLSAGLKYTF